MEVTTKTLLQDGDINKHQDQLIFDPYNFKNHEITQNQVSDILKKYGVPDKVHNFNLYLLHLPEKVEILPSIMYTML